LLRPSGRIASPQAAKTLTMSKLNPNAKPFEIPKPFETPKPYEIPWFGKGLIDLLVLLIAIEVGSEGICDIPLYDFVKSLLADEHNVFVVVLDTGVRQLKNTDALLFTTVFMKLRESMKILHEEWLTLKPQIMLLLEDPLKYPIAQCALNCVRRRTEYIELAKSTHFLQIIGYSYFSDSSNYIESLKSFWEAYIVRVVKTVIYDFLEATAATAAAKAKATKATAATAATAATKATKATKSKSTMVIWQGTLKERHAKFIKTMYELIKTLGFIVNDCVERQELRKNVKLPPSHPEFQPSAEFENALTDVTDLCVSLKKYEKSEKDGITYNTTRGTCETNYDVKKI
jgi:hypothetical protein